MRETRQRAAVLSSLRGGDAVAAQELHARLRSAGARVGLATVYRTLRLLADEGRVDVIRDDDAGESRYRLCSTEHHHHLVCESCGRVEEIPECDVDDWAAKVASDRGFSVRAHSAEITGLCADCGPGV